MRGAQNRPASTSFGWGTSSCWSSDEKPSSEMRGEFGEHMFWEEMHRTDTV